MTLTYGKESLPPWGSLRKSDFQKFMKRLREFYAPQRIRFFHCGEYGSRTRRPHYHCLLFGFDFPDKVVWSQRNANTVWRSPTLEKLWDLGSSEIGSVSFASAAYVARYVVDKVSGSRALEQYKRFDADTGEVVQVTPEYCTMSKGIGKGWFERFGREAYIDDGVVVDGRLEKPPRYYDQMYELMEPEKFRRVQLAREKRGKGPDSTPERLAVREQVALAGLIHHRKEEV